MSSSVPDICRCCQGPAIAVLVPAPFLELTDSLGPVRGVITGHRDMQGRRVPSYFLNYSKRSSNWEHDDIMSLGVPN